MLLEMKILVLFLLGLVSAQDSYMRPISSLRSNAPKFRLSNSLDRWLNSLESDDQWFNDISSNSNKWSKNNKWRSNNKWSNDVDSGERWSKGFNSNGQWSTRSKYQRYSFSNVDTRNDHGWNRYPSFDNIPMPPIPAVPVASRREWPTWIPPIRMIKLPLDTPPERINRS